MELLTADYVLAGLMIVLAVMGLFRGLSGTLGFLAAVLAGLVAATFGWSLSADWFEPVWQRVLAVLVATLLVFGIVRMLVKRMVNGLLAQPADAVFGFLVGVLTWAAVVVAWAYSGAFLEYSAVATEVARYVR